MNTDKFLYVPEEEEEVEYIENKNLQCPDVDWLMSKQAEWDEIDDLIFEYQKAFEDPSPEQKIKSDAASEELLRRFYPLFKKYLTLLTTGQINFNNQEQRLFVYLFMDAPNLKYALLTGKNLDRNTKQIIFQKFNFIRETYGHLTEDEILTDLHYLFFILAKRYKKAERSFCCYVYNAIRYEVARYIQKFTRNPLNIHYRNVSFDDCEDNNNKELSHNNDFEGLEDRIYLNDKGMPDTTWIQGLNCSDLFKTLTPLERKLIVKYYLEKYNDKQISDTYGVHLNTCNTKRHNAVMKLAEALGIKKEDIPRSRNSGLSIL